LNVVLFGLASKMTTVSQSVKVYKALLENTDVQNYMVSSSREDRNSMVFGIKLKPNTNRILNRDQQNIVFSFQT